MSAPSAIDRLGATTHSQADAEAVRDLFERSADVFEQARRQVGVDERWKTIAGYPVRFRFAGPGLDRALANAFALVQREPPRSSTPTLTIDVWDRRVVAGTEATFLPWDRARSTDGRFFQHGTECMVAWLDRAGNRMLACAASVDRLTPGERYQPFSKLLALWLADRSMPAIHAGAVGREKRVVIVCGKSGSGKSTVSLSCLLAGFQYLGDDFVALSCDDDGAFHAHGIYANAHLDRHHLQRFENLVKIAIPPAPGEDKAVLHIGSTFPRQVVPDARIAALVLPRITPEVGTRLRDAPKAAALLALAPSSLFTRPSATREAFDVMANLTDRVPAYWLDMGSDLRQIPATLNGCLGK